MLLVLFSIDESVVDLDRDLAIATTEAMQSSRLDIVFSWKMYTMSVA